MLFYVHISLHYLIQLYLCLFTSAHETGDSRRASLCFALNPYLFNHLP